MRLKLKHITLSLSMLALAACKESVGVLDPVEPTIPDSEKTPIELSVGGVDGLFGGSATRAVITDGDGIDASKLKPFSAATRLFLYLKSEDNRTDAAHTHTTDKYALTYVEAASATTGKSAITTPSAQQLYWDDAHSRCSKLTVYAFAIANKQRGSMQIGSPAIKYGSESGAESKVNFKAEVISPTFDWAVGGGDNFCSQEIFEWGDLIFSNNVADYHEVSGKSDSRMDFNWTTTDPNYHKFDKGDLIFYHALSKITFHVVMGEGFTESDFKFKEDTNIKLKGFNGSGTFNMKDGEFTSTSTKVFDYIAPQNPSIKTADTKKYYEVYSYLVPGTDLKSSTEAEALTLIINNNQYVVPMSTLYKQILANTDNQVNATTVKESVLAGGAKMKAGVNYLFTIKIGKSKINNITAQVVDWENVDAEEFMPSNARIKLNLEERGTTLTSSDRFSLYRAADDNQDINDDHTSYNWKTGYSSNVTPDFVSEANGVPAHWTTNWYWDNNKNFYHFRVLCEAHGDAPKTVVNSIETDATNGDYLTLTSDVNYKDILWGAPMLDVEEGTNENDANATKPLLWLYGPTQKGFDAKDDGKVSAGLPTETQHQIYKAIGPTEDQIKLILFHMMSDVTFNITTTSNSDKVELCHQYVENGETKYKRTRLDLVGFYNGGKVLLGSGLVMTARDGNVSTIAVPVNIPFGSAANNEAYTKQVYTFGAVPQNLAKETTGSVIEKSEDVKLYITTPDNNQYIVDLKDVVTSSITTSNIANPYTQIAAGQPNAGKYKLDRWYPGFKYNYTFKLTKKGIVDIQATIVNWETVTADEQPVTIR